MKDSGSAQDPLWFKDAIIYELHVRAFFDSNNDGIGDFQGLTQRLDYLQDLGVTCLWLLPFFPSPLRDDGYDIADYLNVHPDYGTLDDFRTFLSAAHDRNMQVMIELVINHTSDQHPWFQRARTAPLGSMEREFYVWSETDKKYADARIIFTDTEKSNWTWDSTANAYYWHRFFSHQPDLNYDNPLVLEEIQKAMCYWLDLGVDGLRLDAIPYLVERDGTNCENLAETHVVIKQIRRQMDERYLNRMILAEANQWPTDVRAYFGDGDECHMAFHFPLMPRFFMALRLEDRLPVTDIIAQTPAIPESCQWGVFLRNHDELTLEMVSDEERDYMYFAYSADPRMRVNVGIRRRLAPLMENNRRRIELLNSLLFSFPGTPILYYGDEIGMGDNIYLGDRNGVRTPMQWSADRNAGFSRVTPAKLFNPVIMDPIYGYAALNVEAQQSDPSSLLSWMRNMIALRKIFRVFGRGSIEFLSPPNRKVLAYLRRSEGEEILCVANLSRFPQPVALDLAEFSGFKPIEMMGYVEFPQIGKQPYSLSLGAYEFLWFELHKSVAVDPIPEKATLVITNGWKSVFAAPGLETLVGSALPDFLYKQRWFGGKSRKIAALTVVDWAELPKTETALAWLSIKFDDGATDNYFLAIGKSFGSAAQKLRDENPGVVIAAVSRDLEEGILYDALFDDNTCAALLSCIESNSKIVTRNGTLQGCRSSAYADVAGAESMALPISRGTAEQSNSSIIFGRQLIMKLFRRQQVGQNPDCEIGQYLTEHTKFNRIPPYAGLIEYSSANNQPTTLAMLQGLVANEGDGWRWYLEELERYYESCSRVSSKDAVPTEKSIFLQLNDTQENPEARAHLGICLDSAATLGRRTAELHDALASQTGNTEFAPEPLDRGALTKLASDMEERAAQVFSRLQSAMPKFSEEVTEAAALVLSKRRQVLSSFQKLKDVEANAQRIRIHGDYHLGQVLCVKNDFVILDFEGEPTRSLAERRAKYSPLKDVAGMLRSFSYAAQMGLSNYVARRPERQGDLKCWSRFWEQSVSISFLRAYRLQAAGAPFLPKELSGFSALLEAYLLDKAIYELNYELENRPAWIQIPLSGILALDT
jgi:maltose alpha-D-glucosyltransferase / alpha-amylase